MTDEHVTPETPPVPAVRVCAGFIRGNPCVAAALQGSPYCAVHSKLIEAGSGDVCRKCMQKIRAGTFAVKRPDGGLQHQSCPPKPPGALR